MNRFLPARWKRLVSLIVLLLLPMAAIGDTADEYSDYVNKMIPASRDLARLDAEMRERNRVFNALASQAQGQLTYATSAIATIDYLSPLAYRTPICRVGSDGRVDVKHTLTDLIVSRER